MDLEVKFGLLTVQIHTAGDGCVTFNVSRRGKACFSTRTGMRFEDRKPHLSEAPIVTERTTTLSCDTPHYTKRRTCALEAREVVLDFGMQHLHLHLSAQGFAYRWETRFDSPVTVVEEICDLEPIGTWHYLHAYHNHAHRSDPFQNSWESVHHLTDWAGIEPNRLIYLPLTWLSQETALSFTEAELIDYPGLNLQKTGKAKAFHALMAPMPKTVDASGRRNAFVLERHPWLVQTQGRRLYPWRICMMADCPAQLYENDLPHLLSRPAAGDFSWVQPGRVAWEWWNAWGLLDTPFTPGVNTTTYKAYIDFASAFNIPYVILDEGWAKELDVTEIIPEINLPELISYAHERNVRLILWASWPQLIDCQEHLFNHYSAMGIAGFKIDFYDRDDAFIARQLYETAEIAAKYHMVLAYHGIHKPTGLTRTWPNVLTYEGVFGLENVKWTGNEVNFVQNDVRLAFARLLAGPADYTPGAMVNRHRDAFQKDYYHPMSMGTRCHQAAMFVLYDTGLQMLCDSPSRYQREAAYTHFLTALPLCWDETIALPYSHPERCVAALRRKGDEWVFAVLNNDQPRVVSVPLWLLPPGEYLMTALVDGAHVTTDATNYRFEERYLAPYETIDLLVAGGGGCVVTLRPRTVSA